MSTKEILIAFSVMLFLVSLSCTFDSTDEDQLYENAIDKDEIDPDRDSSD